MNTSSDRSPARDWEHRVRGTLLAAAYADAVTLELATRPGADEGTIDRLTAPVPDRDLQFGHVTGQMLLLACRLVRESAPDPPADGAAVVPAAWDAGTYPSEPALWICPVGLLPGLPLDAVAARARAVAAGIGVPELSQEIAALQAVAVAAVAGRPRGQVLDAADLIATVSAHARSPLLHDALQLVVALTGSRSTRAEVLGQLSTGHPSVVAYVGALHAFLTHPDDPGSLLREALTWSRAGRGAAVMAAALAGARLGDDQVGYGWGTRLRASLRVWSVGGQLAELVHPAAPLAASRATVVVRQADGDMTEASIWGRRRL
ncbi:hypothetical protein KIF24_24640 [Micromonospora sp. Llam7]|uniref:ADP-ribosylglycohydrolase family protein n=1 Tax=Micromonospora tarapacensis TaxID=2835305 RepID=UPI001C832A2B|nr:ADP-ribosylglycohydrolase family protein [Micromonospora tarapacensis]MBX7268902.1 hypothetical protein [Micromonospora tarapacensis]